MARTRGYTVRPSSHCQAPPIVQTGDIQESPLPWAKLIPLSGEGLGDKEQEYVLKAIGRQHSFNEHSITLSAGTIKYLDMEVDTTAGGSISLRQAIGRLNRPDEPTTRIFLAVGWKLQRGPQAAAMGKQVLFAITPDVRIDTQIMINNLLPMFRYKYGDNIARFF
eukprot:scaffold258678_cov32-Attheya_sp.AAC.2